MDADEQGSFLLETLQLHIIEIKSSNWLACCKELIDWFAFCSALIKDDLLKKFCGFQTLEEILNIPGLDNPDSASFAEFVANWGLKIPPKDLLLLLNEQLIPRPAIAHIPSLVAKEFIVLATNGTWLKIKYNFSKVRMSGRNGKVNPEELHSELMTDEMLEGLFAEDAHRSFRIFVKLQKVIHEGTEMLMSEFKRLRQLDAYGIATRKKITSLPRLT